MGPFQSNELIFPAPDKLNNLDYGKFVLTNLAAKRAKQLKEGAPPLVRIASSHPLSIALAEIAAGKIRPILGTEERPAVADDSGLFAFAVADVEDEGLLLPALDDDEALVVDLGDDDEADDFAAEEEEAVEAGSLADLLGEDDEDAVEATSDSADELSLEDLVEEEAEAENEEGEA